jgi:hypothetical protein
MCRGLLFLLFSFLSCHIAGQAFTSSNLPIVVIHTNGQEIPDDPKIIADMGIVYNGQGVINHLSDPFTEYKGKIGIETRGKSSQMFPMKSYGFELRDDNGESVDKSLFGLPEESDWILYAPYTDKTLMRNFLAYTISLEMGHWAAHCRYVELVLNDDYRGVYILMEKIKRGSGRVNISKLKKTDVAGDDVTGGYIFKIDKEDPGDDGWYSSVPPVHAANGQTIHFLYEYPKPDAIVSEQKNYIKNYVDSFEFALNGTRFQDPVNGFRRFADENSFIDFLLVNEVSHNVDGYRLSTFIYKDKTSKGGKLVAGPVWDYDLAFRNADYYDGSATTGWMYQSATIDDGDYWQVPFWWKRMMDDTAFQAHLRCRWKELRQTTLSDQHLFFLIDSVATFVNEAQQRHFQRWPVLGQYVWPNPAPIPTSYAGEISALKEWITERMHWIDLNMPNIGACFVWPATEKGTLKVELYPNPFQTTPFVKIISRQPQKVTISVTDALGRQLFLQTIPVVTGVNNISLNTNHWSSGLYIFRFRAAAGDVKLYKLIRQ